MTEAVTISLKVCALSAVIADKSVDLLQQMKFHVHFAAAYINSHFVALLCGWKASLVAHQFI